jgi:hypothetical protein
LTAQTLEAQQDGPVEGQLRIGATVAASVGLVGLLLAAIGVYGVTAYSHFEQGADEVSSPSRSSEIKEHRSAIRLHSHAESKEPAAVTFGIDNPSDQSATSGGTIRPRPKRGRCVSTELVRREAALPALTAASRLHEGECSARNIRLLRFA